MKNIINVDMYGVNRFKINSLFLGQYTLIDHNYEYNHYLNT